MKMRCAPDAPAPAILVSCAHPGIGGFLQHVKSGGREVEALVLAEIAAELQERIAAHEGTVLLGPGSTVMVVKEALGIDGTLLGG